MKLDQLKQKSRSELYELLKGESSALSEIRRNLFSGKEKNTSLIRKKHLLIARVQTLLSQMDILHHE